MTTKKLKKLFELCGELYAEEQEKSGMLTPIPYAYAKYGGEMVVFSSWLVDTKRIEKAIKNIKYETHSENHEHL